MLKGLVFILLLTLLFFSLPIAAHSGSLHLYPKHSSALPLLTLLLELHLTSEQEEAITEAYDIFQAREQEITQESIAIRQKLSSLHQMDEPDFQGLLEHKKRLAALQVERLENRYNMEKTLQDILTEEQLELLDRQTRTEHGKRISVQRHRRN